MSRIKTTILSICSLFLLLTISESVAAQSNSGGKMSIRENGFISVFGEHNFMKGSGVVPAGKIKTARTGSKGYLNFVTGSSWVGASDENFVDGYVRVYHKEPFIFPIGDNNKFRPVAISGGAKTTAAYYAESPTTRTNELPAEDSKTLERISNREYWDIGGSKPVKITFTWDATSNIANITGGSLKNLKVIGWTGEQWKVIDSGTNELEKVVINQLNIQGKPSLNQGMITTEELIPDDYEFFTLGATTGEAEIRSIEDFNSQFTMYPNPVQEELFVDLTKMAGKKGLLKIYNLYGQLVQERAYDSASENLQVFDASNMDNGMYKLHIKIDNKTYASKFVVHRLY